MQLVATNGPLTGTAITLADGVTIGDPAGPGDSRPCCRLQGSADRGFMLRVIDAQTPIFVNGLPITNRVLDARDELRIGDSLFVVREEEPAPPSTLSPCAVQLESSSAARQLFEFDFEDALVHQGRVRQGFGGHEGTASTRDSRDLATLLRVSATLSAIQGLATLDAALAGLVLDIVPGERVVLAGGEDGPTVVQSAWSVPGTTKVSAHVNGRLLERAVKERRALAAEIDGRQVIVAPMMAFGRASGSIWVETSCAGQIDEGHVRLLLVIGALAAVAREQARETTRLQHTNEVLQAEINLEHNMVGRSKPMRVLFDRIARVARTEATVLIRGESGTGKELVARAAHRNSTRANRPFIAINCAAITETLLESELIGHEKGAFTGAIRLKKGKVELADGGTLFLDEIGELPLPLQAKLLRAIQEREFERVGGTRPVRVDFRLIVATNRDLEAAVKGGTFRQDLFYRLNVVTLSLPPLRDRKEDLPLLADHFVRKHAAHTGRRMHGLAPEALARLAKHDWPGNVRELENVIEQALALGSDDRIVVEDLPMGLGESSGDDIPTSVGSSLLNYHAAVEQAKRELIVRALEHANHSPAAAARLLGVHPNYLHRLMRNLNLRQARPSDRNEGTGR
jgi:transcriptional regulator with GAF, ATPase, and Fis domain